MGSTKRCFSLLLALAAVLFLAGCHLIIVGEDPRGDITVRNISGYDVSTVYISRTGGSDWGNDVLDGTPLYDGDRILIENLPTGLYDLYAETWGGEVCWEEYNVLLTNDGYTWELE